MPAFNYFNATTQDLAEAVHNFKTGSATVYKVMLINSTAPVATNHLYSDISGNEITGGGTTGYTAGGAAVTITDSLSTSTETVSGAAVTWTAGASGFTARYAVLYNSTTGQLVGWWDYGSSFTITSGNQLQISWASGVLTVTHA